MSSPSQWTVYCSHSISLPCYNIIVIKVTWIGWAGVYVPLYSCSRRHGMSSRIACLVCKGQTNCEHYCSSGENAVHGLERTSPDNLIICHPEFQVYCNNEGQLQVNHQTVEHTPAQAIQVTFITNKVKKCYGCNALFTDLKRTSPDNVNIPTNSHALGMWHTHLQQNSSSHVHMRLLHQTYAIL